MSKKDYVAFAALVRDLSNTLSDPTQAWDIAVRDFIDEMADLFESDNPHFNRQQFLNACGVG